MVDVTDPNKRVLVGIGNFRPVSRFPMSMIALNIKFHFECMQYFFQGTNDIDTTHFTSVYAHRVFIDDKSFIP